MQDSVSSAAETTPQIIRGERARRRRPQYGENPISFDQPETVATTYTTSEPKGEDTAIARVELPAESHANAFPSVSKLEMVPVDEHMGYIGTGAMIINRVIGSGIFVVPATALALVGSKGATILAWLLGCLVAWGG